MVTQGQGTPQAPGKPSVEQGIADNQIRKHSQVEQFALAQVPFHRHNGSDSPKVSFLDLASRAEFFQTLLPGPLINNYSISTNTNGTTAVSVFGSSGLTTVATITGVFLIATDNNAANITVENPSGTVVATIAKGTTGSALVGATSLANTTVTAGTNLIVKSSAANGNATVIITYTTTIGIGVFFTAPLKCSVTNISEVHQIAGTDGSAVTLQVEKLQGTTASGSGTNLLSSGFNLKSTANKVTAGTLAFIAKSNFALAKGDRLGLVLSGTPTSVLQVLVQVQLNY